MIEISAHDAEAARLPPIKFWGTVTGILLAALLFFTWMAP